VLPSAEPQNTGSPLTRVPEETYRCVTKECLQVTTKAIMSTPPKDQSYEAASRPQPALNTLPSELRRLIVSHLAPSPDSLKPDSKTNLKNANLAHSCLHEWAPEYMFRDMALKHVLVGMSSHLECFAANPNNTELFKFVKHIVVQVRLSCNVTLWC
jgi:hypothetical protein